MKFNLVWFKSQNLETGEIKKLVKVKYSPSREMLED